MVNQLLVNLVNSVLGSGKATARNNYAYSCPFCHHHKPKLEVNLTENREGKNPWHCWACDKKGNTLYQLFRLMKAPGEKTSEAKSLISSSRSIKDTKVEYSVALPDEFISLSNVISSDITARHALAYLKRRNISKYDILKYNIGYCKEGRYKNMIILPKNNSSTNSLSVVFKVQKSAFGPSSVAAAEGPCLAVPGICMTLILQSPPATARLCPLCDRSKP